MSPTLFSCVLFAFPSFGASASVVVWRWASALAAASAGEPVKLVGDGKYHKYTIDWHTGGVKMKDGSLSQGYVSFLFDDILMVQLCALSHKPLNAAS